MLSVFFLAAVFLSTQPTFMVGITLNLLVLGMYMISKYGLAEFKNEGRYNEVNFLRLGYIFITSAILIFGLFRVINYNLSIWLAPGAFVGLNFFGKFYFLSEIFFGVVFVWLLFKLLSVEVIEIKSVINQPRNESIPPSNEINKEDTKMEKTEIDEIPEMSLLEEEPQGPRKIPVIIYSD